MNLRFVEGSTLVSDLIEDREGACLPFTPSHVEICVPEGYLGARSNGGVQIKPPGYDLGFRKDLVVTVPLPDEKTAETYARSMIGQPYDWAALLDFVLPVNFHAPRHKICSAFATIVLGYGGYWADLAVPAHAISPRDLLLMLSARLPIAAVAAAKWAAKAQE